MGTCEKAGAHLVKMESEKENDFLHAEHIHANLNWPN